MSAIAGLWRTEGQPVDRHEVDRMAAALAHRAPDGTHAWHAGPVAMAHGARWTTPEARHERQPLTSRAGNVVVADARLDNRAELLATLGLSASTAADVGDGQLILRAYERWGQECVPRLVGDFAFALWDAGRRQLFAARDVMGVKPLYYHQAPGVFLFSSEIKALLASPLVPYRLNAARVADYLVGHLDDGAGTLYRDVCRLPAAHTLTVGHAGLQIRRYWSWNSTREIRLGSDGAYAEAFRACFTEAVQSRLRSSHPVGSLLSGGLDTSSIVATARHLRRAAGAGRLDTFTAIFPGLPEADLRVIDERPFVDAVVAQGGLQPHYVRGDLLSPLTDVERALWHLDEAFVAPNLYLHWALYGAARDHGVRCLLDGIDGDTTVSHGLERFGELALGGRVPTLARELRALAGRYGVGTASLFYRFALPPLIPAWARHGAGLRRPDPLAGSIVSRALARRTGLVERLRDSERRQRHPASAREAHRRALGAPYISVVLEMADKAAAAFGIEPRYPFFDRRLMELCLALPADQKLRAGWTRAVLRQAMGGLLPEQVRWRADKANLAPNFLRRLLERDHDLLREVVVERPQLVEDYVDVPALRRAYDRYVTHPTSEADALTVHRAVMLGLWLQRAKVPA
jgi:asparagine synthase (glutamine-hydrolysing)